MNKTDKIFIAGHNGLVGSALVRKLTAEGYTNLLLRSHKELDLSDHCKVRDFFNKEHPKYVFLAAAKVGGIHANNSMPAEFIYQNLVIQNNVIHESYVSEVSRLIFLGSSCIYPRDCQQPIKEDYLLTGNLEPTNRPYAIAKIAGIEMCWSYNRQYKTRFLAVMPTNLYGPNDNFDLNNSHVIPALIRKAHEAKSTNAEVLTVWGTGNPRREFLYSDDMAEACIHIIKLEEHILEPMLAVKRNNGTPPLINIGCGKDQSIKETAELICKVVGFKGKLAWDLSKPDGTPQKLLDVSRLNNLNWKPKISFKAGLELAYRSFLEKLN